MDEGWHYLRSIDFKLTIDQMEWFGRAAQKVAAQMHALMEKIIDPAYEAECAAYLWLDEVPPSREVFRHEHGSSNVQ